MKRILVLGALACAASIGFAHKARVDFDRGIHFSCYKTYSWVHSADASSPQALFPNQLMRERISGYIDEALAARGLKRVTTGGDLLISYQVKVTEQPLFTTFSDGPGPGWGWDWGWGSGFSTTTVQNIYDGTLVIDMVDANQQQLVFQGTSTHTISSRPEKNAKRLAKAVSEVFEKYPPRP
jgi:Domain of unknown function (DUF4136)